MTAIFATAEDVENAFYDAIARADLDALMMTWADDEEIVCIHPTGQRLQGAAAIRESWRAIFTGNPRFTIRVTHGVRWRGMILTVHNVFETLYLGDEQTPQGPLLASNIFQRGAAGWRLVSHHASAASEGSHETAAGSDSDGSSRTLH